MELIKTFHVSQMSPLVLYMCHFRWILTFVLFLNCTAVWLSHECKLLAFPRYFVVTQSRVVYGDWIYYLCGRYDADFAVMVVALFVCRLLVAASRMLNFRLLCIYWVIRRSVRGPSRLMRISCLVWVFVRCVQTTVNSFINSLSYRVMLHKCDRDTNKLNPPLSFVFAEQRSSERKVPLDCCD